MLSQHVALSHCVLTRSAGFANRALRCESGFAHASLPETSRGPPLRNGGDTAQVSCQTGPLDSLEERSCPPGGTIKPIVEETR